MTQIIELQPDQLTIHPDVRSLPKWSPTDPRFIALVDDIRANGITQPIHITADHQVVDGRHRYAAARVAGVSIPCIVTEKLSVLEIAISSMLHRQHYNSSQRAYWVAGKIDDAWATARKRMRAGGSPTLPGKTPADWAKEIGVSLRYLQMARDIQQMFAAHPETYLWNEEPGKELTLQEYLEPRIFADENPMNLGDVAKAIGSKLESARGTHRGGKPAEPTRQQELFTAAWDTVATRFEYWNKFDDESKARITRTISSTFSTMPDDLLESTSRAAASELKRRLAAR